MLKILFGCMDLAYKHHIEVGQLMQIAARVTLQFVGYRYSTKIIANQYIKGSSNSPTTAVTTNIAANLVNV